MNNGIHDNQSAITSSISAFDTGSSPKRQLGPTACKQIERFVLVPILKEPRLKPFHPLVRSVPQRIINKQIVCLRDLEKTLLWLAPVSQYIVLLKRFMEFWLLIIIIIILYKELRHFSEFLSQLLRVYDPVLAYFDFASQRS